MSWLKIEYIFNYIFIRQHFVLETHLSLYQSQKICEHAQMTFHFSYLLLYQLKFHIVSSHPISIQLTLYPSDSLYIHSTHPISIQLTLYPSDSLYIHSTHPISIRLTLYPSDSPYIHPTHPISIRLTLYSHDSPYIYSTHPIFT